MASTEGEQVSHYFGEEYPVYDERFPRARKPHKCDACGEPIAPGHRYARIGIVSNHSAETLVRCLRCQTIHEHLRGLGDADDRSWPDERLDCGEEYREHWQRDPPADIAALAFVTPDEMQARGES